MIDLAELATPSASQSEILQSILALNLDREPDQFTQPQHGTTQRYPSNSGGTSLAKAAKGPPAKRPVQDTAGKEQATLQQASSAQQEATKQQQLSHEQQHAQTQQASQDPAQQQYTTDDWNAYWQYYGYTEAPPAPPAVPPLCSGHVAQLQQMMESSTAPQLAAQTPQVPESKLSHIDTREALQSRADKLQGGKLTALLMSWFDAGYQTGRMENELQQS